MTSKLKTILLTFLLVSSIPLCTFAIDFKNPTHGPCNKLLTFRVKSPAFTSGSVIPLKNVCSKIAGGQNISIPLVWTGAQTVTKSFAVLMYDLNPAANNFVHWAVINIPSEVFSLCDGASGTINMPVGSIELINSSGSSRYIGPCPPSGTGKHEYKIIVYALSIKNLNIPTAVNLEQFETVLKGNIIDQAEISGFFEQ